MGLLSVDLSVRDELKRSLPIAQQNGNRVSPLLHGEAGRRQNTLRRSELGVPDRYYRQ